MKHTDRAATLQVSRNHVGTKQLFAACPKSYVRSDSDTVSVLPRASIERTNGGGPVAVSEPPVTSFAEVIENVDSPLLVVDPDGAVLASNRAFGSAFGAPPTNLAELSVDTDEADGAIALVTRVRARDTASGTLAIHTASGQLTRAGFSLTPIGGDALGGCSILALEPHTPDGVAASAELVALAEGAPCVVWFAEPDGAITLTNDRWRTTFGAAADAGASPTSAALHPDDYGRCSALWEESLRRCEPYETVARHRVDADSYRRFLTRAVPVRSESGEVLGWLGTTTDVDATAEGEAGEPRPIEGAERAEASEALLSTASHELRGPLTVLQGTVQLAKRRAASRALTQDEVAEVFEQVAEQTQRALRLVEQLLDHARIANERLELQPVPTDLTVLAQNVVASIKGAADSHEIEVKAPAPCIAEVDGPRIEQVLFNLLDNAMKFSRAGSRIDVTVTAAQRDGADVVEIAVRDRGRGVPRTERARIFERFHQVTGDDAGQGLGIGLAVSKEIVELHGGSITVGTPRGGGTRFAVQLPLRQSKDAPGPTLEEVPVDDEPDARAQ